MEQKKILLVADDPDLSFVYEAILTSKGYIVTATDVTKFENHIKKGSFNLALIDIDDDENNNLPNVLHLIKRTKPGIPVISLTLVDEISIDTNEESHEKVDLFLEKPINPDSLTDAIDDILSKEIE